MNIELYIGDRLCDIGSPENLGIYLKRVFIKPSELSTKDAQKSYEISLPATPTNNEIFHYTNVEEVQGKFRVYDNVRLYIDGILILDGKFRVSQITADAYVGNLGVPAAITVKDIFGETKLTEIAPYNIDFKGFAESVSNWNKGIYDKDKYGDIPPCIFPYVLYGLLPKVSKTSSISDYSPMNIWDSTVRIGVEDLPPSINVLNMLKHIFKAKKYTLTGTAIEDPRLNSLYMSYSNETNYQQEWNWGDLGKINVKGTWDMAEIKSSSSRENFERQISLNEDEYGGYYTVDLFNSNRAKLSFEDSGTNIIYNEYKDKYTDKSYTRKNLSLSIPQSGYYKVTLTCAQFKLDNARGPFNPYPTYKDNNNKFTNSGRYGEDRNNCFDRSRYEIQVLRDYGTGDFKNTNIVGFYNRPQFPQTPYDEDRNQFPKYYPMSKGPMVIDPSLNENFICGLHWGEHENDKNPKDTTSRCNYMFIANGFSRDKQFSQNKKILCAYDSSVKGYEGNYWCWGTEENVEEGTVVTEGEPKPTWLAQPVKRRYGKLNNYTNSINSIDQIDYVEGKGKVECIIWLEKGEKLTVGIAGDMGDRYTNVDEWIVLIENVTFELNIEPFRTDISWNNFSNNGSYDPYNLLSWTISESDSANFQKNKIDLVKFLPNNVRTDEFIDNFCKAFNLNLSQTGEKEFSLDIKQTEKTVQDALVDIDPLSSVKDKVNESLGLPSVYSIGFTANEEEEGFVKTGENGGGVFTTGSDEGNRIDQKSKFSYNWFKDIQKQESYTTIILPLPVISKAEVWIEGDKLYPERMSKQHTDLPQRFWYFDGLLSDLGASFNVGGLGNEKKIELAKVTNSLPGLNTLSYKNGSNTILTNYFTLFANANTDYTLIECYLQPDQYVEIGKGAKVKFNGDIYHVAEIDGYDPLNRKKCKLKLIRDII